MSELKFSVGRGRWGGGTQTMSESDNVQVRQCLSWTMSELDNV